MFISNVYQCIVTPGLQAISTYEVKQALVTAISLLTPFYHLEKKSIISYHKFLLSIFGF